MGRKCKEKLDLEQLAGMMRGLLEERKKQVQFLENKRSKHKVYVAIEEKLMDSEFKKTQEIQSLFKRNDRNRQLKMELMKRELSQKEKKLKEQAQKQKVYLALVRQSEAEKQAKEANKFTRIALEHVSLFRIIALGKGQTEKNANAPTITAAEK